MLGSDLSEVSFKEIGTDHLGPRRSQGDWLEPPCSKERPQRVRSDLSLSFQGVWLGHDRGELPRICGSDMSEESQSDCLEPIPEESAYIRSDHIQGEHVLHGAGRAYPRSLMHVSDQTILFEGPSPSIRSDHNAKRKKKLTLLLYKRFQRIERKLFDSF